MIRPTINVTPLIDVLLVLIIIFMIVAPIKPNSFKTRIPAEPNNDQLVNPNPDTLAVIVAYDGTLRINNERDLGSDANPSKLTARLAAVFDARIQNGNIAREIAAADRPYRDSIERTVFIKAPKGMSYGKIVHVVDAVKMAGGFPISLQIDDLPE